MAGHAAEAGPDKAALSAKFKTEGYVVMRGLLGEDELERLCVT